MLATQNNIMLPAYFPKPLIKLLGMTFSDDPIRTPVHTGCIRDFIDMYRLKLYAHHCNPSNPAFPNALFYLYGDKGRFISLFSKDSFLNMRKPLSKPFEDERPRLNVGFIANKKVKFLVRKTYTFLCGKKDYRPIGEKGRLEGNLYLVRNHQP
jgi:hypothetical protein